MNEAVLFAMALLDFGVVFGAWMLGRAWLYVTIVVNLRLIVLVGAKLISAFGLVTNAGNVFYASVFFAMYLLLEHGAPKDAARAVWIGVASALMFFGFAALSLTLESAPETRSVSDLLSQAISVTPRIAAASVSGFVLAQVLNILLYLQWSESVSALSWWVRAASVMAAAQLVDSVIFFSITFFGFVPTQEALEIMFAGYLVKVVLGLLAIPLLFLSHRLPARDMVRAAA